MLYLRVSWSCSGPLDLYLSPSGEHGWDEKQHQYAFDTIKESLPYAPVLALPDEKSHSASFVMLLTMKLAVRGCKRTMKDANASLQSKQLEATERNYPVHDTDLLAMKYSLVKFRVHLLAFRSFVIYTDHASLRTATTSTHLSQRMAGWLSFFAEYYFRDEYKPSKFNVFADALSRRPDFELANVSQVTKDRYDRIRLAYQVDENYTPLNTKVDRFSPRQWAQLHLYKLADGLLHYRVDPEDPPRIIVSNDEDLKNDIFLERMLRRGVTTLAERRSTKRSLRHLGGPACTNE
ncbi:Pol protein [Phytophthora palmivora]|uniref:Pol protein n=1 Tax=Phytophthora palmivora TaxID=4796 RepID=A0A2P4XBL1_9STRA|nr:Pol protein [Phytophthora palmivora]